MNDHKVSNNDASNHEVVMVQISETVNADAFEKTLGEIDTEIKKLNSIKAQFLSCVDLKEKKVFYDTFNNHTMVIKSIIRTNASKFCKSSDPESIKKYYRSKLQDKLKDVIECVDLFQQTVEKEKRRKLEIICPEITPEESEKVSYEHLQEVYQKYLMTDNLKQVILDIEKRHQSILSLEVSMLELREMFKDMAFLVEQQQEQLDQIEDNIVSAKSNVEAGNKHLVDAKKLQGKSRCKMCCLLVMFLMILTAILVYLDFTHRI